jgi:hypothetical protein
LRKELLREPNGYEHSLIKQIDYAWNSFIQKFNTKLYIIDFLLIFTLLPTSLNIHILFIWRLTLIYILRQFLSFLKTSESQTNS